MSHLQFIRLPSNCAVFLNTHGKDAMNKRWSEYIEERKAAKAPVKLWEQAAIADTVRGLAKVRESLFRVIQSLESNGWKYDAPLVQALRRIAENESAYVVEEVIEAFRHA